MKISIIVINYNYARFIGAAIDSALAQDWPNTELIVVDNGSTDDSWSKILAYGDRITPIRTFPNRGVGAGYNAGFERSTGDWVLFLDADDVLDADALSAAAALISEETSKVQFRMRHMDKEGNVIRGVVPYLLHEGDVRPLLRKFGHYAGPPGSGNLYRRDAIALYFPLSVETWWLGADTVPFALAPFHGRVASIWRTLGGYRLHWSNTQTRGVLGNNKLSLAEAYLYDDQIRTNVLALLREKSGIVIEGPFTPMPTTVRKRALSWKLRPEEHPHAHETRRGFLRMQMKALSSWPGYRFSDKIVQMAWLAALLSSPRSMAIRLADGNTAGSIRQWMQKLTPRRQGQQDAVARRGQT